MGSSTSTEKVAATRPSTVGESTNDPDKTLQEVLTNLDTVETKWSELVSGLTLDKVSRISIIASMKAFVSQSIVMSTALDKMKDPAKKSVEAYKHFNKLLNTPHLLKNYPKLVETARKIQNDYWKLLGDTTTQVTKIMSKNKTVLCCIDIYEDDCKFEKDGIPRKNVIDDCIKSLQEWLEACEPLESLHERYKKLEGDAEGQHKDWKQIEDDKKNEFEEARKGALKCLGITAVVAVVGAALILSGPVGLLIGAGACLTWGETLSVAGVAIAGSAAATTMVFTKWKECKKAEATRERCKKICEDITRARKILGEISRGAKEIGNDVLLLHQDGFEIKAAIENLEKQAKDMKKNVNESNTPRIQRNVKRITKDFMEIKKKLNGDGDDEGFIAKCDKCIKDIRKSRDNIIKLCNKNNKV